MRNEKIVRAWINSWGRSRMVTFLEDQAQKGWMFAGFSGLGWKFRRIEPQKIHFSVVYFPDATKEDSKSIQKLLEFREYCAHGGWKLASASGELQVFYSTRENPVPIDTDPRIEIETMHTIALRKLRPELKRNAGYGIFYVLLGLFALHDNPIWVFQYVLLHLWFFTYFGKLLVALLRVAEQYLWHWQAKRYASRYDEFPHDLKRLRISSVVDALVDIVLLEMIVRQLGVIRVAGMIAVVAIIISAIVYAMGWIDRQFFLSRTSKILKVTSVIAIVVVCCSLYYGALTLFHIEIDLYAPLGSSWAQYEEVPPVSMEEYYGDGLEDPDYFSQVMETPFLAEYKAQMDADRGEDWLQLNYTILEVKWDILYDTCLEEYLEGICYPVDDAPWGAERAYRYGSTITPQTLWLLCYEDRIVQFYVSEEPTREQMALVGQALGNEQNFENSENS